MININSLTKSYGSLQVLKGIDLHIERGQIYGLAGRSGTGKSTLLRCINGLETYDNGNLYVDGIDVKTLSKLDIRVFRKDIGMIFQQFSLLSRLSVYENIALPLKCWKYKSKDINKKVLDLLEMVGIPDKIHAKPNELSGGQKQRVAIARALALNPKLLLCDEATSALDPKTAKSIISLLNKINQELAITIIIVTHQMSVLRSACEHMAILENGRIEVHGSVEQTFLNHPQALKNLIGQKELMLPETGVNMEIFLSKEISSKPIITQMARDLSVNFMILGGGMEGYRNNMLGSIVINVAGEYFAKVERYLSAHNVMWKYIERDGELCKEEEDNCLAVNFG